MFACFNCDYKSIKWLGKCPNCGEWQSFIKEEESITETIGRKKVPPQLLKNIEGEALEKIRTGIDEFDSILGGGLVEGEVILIGGEPGIGKSTLLLEVGSKLSHKAKTLYVSAEESPQQVALRARNLTSESHNLYILGEDNLDEVVHYIKEEDFKFVVVDSIQVVCSSSYEGSKGSISQIKGCADYLTQLAKSSGVVIFVIGHVTKDGVIAGPKLLEHIVDCVLYFEGEVLSNYRILRAIKNRFGPTQNFAVFEMTSSGLREVKRVTDFFLPHKELPLAGSCVICAIEGVRPILLELQSLVGRGIYPVVRRRCLGFDYNRFSLLVAIIEKRLKFSLSSEDIFLNVAGGLKITDPAADLGVVVAIISSFKEREISPAVVFMGEIGLAGELRHINNINLRLKEVERGGFKKCFIPKSNLNEVDKSFNLKIDSFSLLKEVVEEIFN